MDRLDELSLLVTIVEEGSLVGAARRLGLSGSAVTRILAGLEQRVGARLVERTTRRSVPTERGLRLADRGRALLADYEDAVSAEAGAPLAGLLRVTAPVRFGCMHVSPVVSAFLEAHPALRVELVLDDAILDLVAERLDVGVRLGVLADSSLLARRLGQVRRYLVASPAYLARRGTPTRLTDLPTHETISRPGAEAKEWRFGPGSRPGSVRITPRLLTAEVEARCGAAIAGRGIARLWSYQVDEALADGRLVRLLPDTEPPPVPVHLVTPGGRFRAPRVQLFLDHAATLLKAAAPFRHNDGDAAQGSPE